MIRILRHPHPPLLPPPYLENSTNTTNKHLLGNDTVRTELGRKGRQLVSSRHTYASRVLSVLSTMEDVLALKSPGVCAEEAPAGAPANAPLGGISIRAINVQANPLEVKLAPPPAPPPGCCYRLDMVATASSAYPPKTDHSTLPTNSTTTAAIPGKNEEGVPPSLFGCPEGVPNGDMSIEERRREKCVTDCLFESFSPSALPRATSSKTAQLPPDQTDMAVAGRIGDDNDDGGATADRNGGRRTRTGSEVPEPVLNIEPPQSTPQTSSLLVRPNAPMVLMIFRSDSPPPENLRRDLESAACSIAGRTRIHFMQVSATSVAPDSMLEKFGSRETGVREKEAARRKDLEARLSRLLAGADAGVNLDYISLGAITGKPEKPTSLSLSLFVRT